MNGRRKRHGRRNGETVVDETVVDKTGDRAT